MDPLTNLLSTALLDACTSFATAVARALADRDAAIVQELAAMEGFCCQLECTEPPVTVHFAVRGSELVFLRDTAEEPHVIVQGSAQALLHGLWPALVPAPSQSLRIDGDEGVLLAFQTLAARCRPDPVDGLAQTIGEEATARLLAVFDLGWRGVQTAMEAVQTELDTRGRERFVDAGALDALLTRTDALRLRVDRLEARADLIAQTLTDAADPSAAP